MKKILLAVDETKGSLSVIELLKNLFDGCTNNGCAPENITLLYVQRLEGRSIMDGLLLSSSETETLKESLQGTDYQEKMNHEAQNVLGFFQKLLEKHGFSGIVPRVCQGHPAEEILKAAQENEVELIIMGSRGRRLHNLWMGSISREVANNAPMSVLIAR
jgi:nucleotide-binding universal stress UspA family protein